LRQSAKPIQKQGDFVGAELVVAAAIELLRDVLHQVLGLPLEAGDATANGGLVAVVVLLCRGGRGRQGTLEVIKGWR
jgi:hypothetical protein